MEQTPRNPLAVWSWVLALPCAAAGLVLGVVALVLAQRRGGAGRVHAVVGVTASATVLAAGAAAAAVVLAVTVVGGHGGTTAAAGAGGTDGPGAAGATEPAWGTSRGHDDSVTALTAPEQDYVDDLDDETWQRYDDATLVTMGHQVCDALDDGATPPEADAALVSGWDGLDLDTAYALEWSATRSLCPGHAAAFDAWDPATTDPPGHGLVT